MGRFLNQLRSKLECQKGQGTVEYALITIAVVAIIALIIGLGDQNPLYTAINNAFGKVSTAVTAVPTS